MSFIQQCRAEQVVIRKKMNQSFCYSFVRKCVFFFTIYFMNLSITAKAEAPNEVVQHLQNALIVSANIVNFDKRVEMISPAVIQTHDFPVIARLVTGRHWRKLDTQQRDQFINVFTQLSTMTYASRFKGLATSKFSYVETLKQSHNSIKIISTLALDSNADFSGLSDKRQFTFEYILRPVKQDDASVNERWKVINVIVDGVSDLALKRSNYVSILNEKGFDSLMTELNEKIVDIKEKSSKN